MKNFTVQLYQKSDYKKWNDFINQAKNATFLFHRDFMEYHFNRFQDYSFSRILYCFRLPKKHHKEVLIMSMNFLITYDELDFIIEILKKY